MSRLNPIFFQKNWVETAHPDFKRKAQWLVGTQSSQRVMVLGIRHPRKKGKSPLLGWRNRMMAEHARSKMKILCLIKRNEANKVVQYFTHLYIAIQVETTVD